MSDLRRGKSGCPDFGPRMYSVDVLKRIYKAEANIGAPRAAGSVGSGSALLRAAQN